VKKDVRRDSAVNSNFLSTDDLIDGENITDVVVVSENLQQVTGNVGVSVSNKFLVVELSDNLVDLVTVKDIVDVNIVNIFNPGVGVVTGWVGVVITEDGLNIDGWDDASEDFPNVVKGKGLKDGVELDGDVLVDEESLEESILHDDITFNIVLGDGVDLRSGNNLFVNLDIDDLGWLIDDLGFTSDRLDNNLLVGRGDLDISSDLGDLSNGWLVDEEGLVDLVQKEFVADGIKSLSVVVVSSSEEGGGVPVRVVGGVWVSRVGRDDGSFNSMSEDLVQVFLNGDVMTGVVSLDIVVVSGGGVLVVDSFGGVWGALGDDLELWDDVLVEEDWVTEVLHELWDGPELLEKWRLNISSEDGWVLLPELTEERDGKVLTEEGVRHQLLNVKKGDLTLSPARFDIIPVGVGGWGVVKRVQQGLPGEGREPVGVREESILQKQIMRFLF